MEESSIFILLSYLLTGALFFGMTFFALLKNTRLKKMLRALEASKEG